MKKVFTVVIAGAMLFVNGAYAQSVSNDNTIALVESGDDISISSTVISGDEPEVGSFMVIELLSLTATERDEYNLIDWTTLSEKNNDYFTFDATFNAKN